MLSSLPPLNKAVHGATHCLVCGGMIPGKDVLCNIVDMRLDWIDTKFPPMPFIIGWNTT